ncbi:MAG: hypothetical protein ACXWM2_03555 [Parachlamydiaceae bacterium]
MNKWIAYLIAAFFPTMTTGFEYTGPAHMVQANQSLEALSQQLAVEHKLYLLNLSFGDIADALCAPWGLSYTSNEQYTIEQIRPTVKTLVQTFLRKIHYDPLFLNYYLKSTYRHPFGVDSIAFKIAFWNEDVDRPLSPYLAQVRYANGNIYYYYADPETQALTEPVVESLESLGITADKYLNS